MGYLLLQVILTLQGGVRCRASGRLTLESQCRHLYGNGVSGVIVVFIFGQRDKHFLYVGVGRGISLVACSGRCGIQSPLECFLGDVLQLDPSLVNVGKEVPPLKCLDIKSGTQEKANRSEYQLLVSVWVLSQHGNLGAILDAAK